MIHHNSFTVELPDLYPGDEAPIVYVLQSILDARGYSANGVRVPYSGKMDEQTVETVQSFQKRNGICATGIVESAMWNKLLFETEFASY